MANPNKSKPILDILLRNREKLTDFLTKFHTDRTGGQSRVILGQVNPLMGQPQLMRKLFFSAEDQQFNDEKQYLIKQIREMQPAAATATATTEAAAV